MKTDKLLREAKICFVSGQLEKCIDLFNAAEKTGAEQTAICLSRGAALMALGRYWEAKDDFTTVIDDDSTNERAYYYRGIAYVALGEFQPAIEDLTQTLIRNNDRGIAHLVRGLAYAELGQKDDAILDFNTASAFTGAELKSFKKLFGDIPVPFDSTKALLAKENAPWNNLISEDSANILSSLLSEN
jgi:tetratricopeptide (TPR) repeat protein